MKTWQAALTHIALANIQAISAVQFFDSTTPVGILGNTQIQLGTQVGLTLLQAWIAKKNSTTDPEGNKLNKTIDGFNSTSK